MSGYWGIRNFGKLERDKEVYMPYLGELKTTSKPCNELLVCVLFPDVATSSCLSSNQPINRPD